MATFAQVINKALGSGQMKIVSVNQNMMEIAKETKKKPAFVKTGISEELAGNLMMNKEVAFLIHMDGDLLNQLSNEIDAEEETETEIDIMTGLPIHLVG